MDLAENEEDQPFDANLTPMLATLVDKPFDDPGWVYEIKWDGYRAMAFISEGKANLKSRNNISFNEKFYPVYEAVSAWKINAVIDGEVVVVNEKGVSDFNSLQNWRSDANGELQYYVFDILWYNGRDLTGLPLTERKAILQTLVPAEGIIRSGYSVAAEGTSFFEAARELGLEGIMAKKSDSLYFPGTRSKEWLKIKINRRQEVIIAGFTKNPGTPKQFSSLLLGVYEGRELVYVGKVGTGFNDQQQRELMEIFRPLIITENPFSLLPEYKKPSGFRPHFRKLKATWLQPVLVCEVSFAEITADGLFRHPSYESLRIDKNAEEVTLERKEAVTNVVSKDST